MNVLLVNPPSSGYGSAPTFYISDGLAYISAALKQAGHNVTCVNGSKFLAEKCLEDEFKTLAANQTFDMIGTGGMSCAYTSVKEVVHLGKKYFPQAGLLVGGHILTCMPELIMRDMEIDYGIIGEGDISTVLLLEALEAGRDPRTVPGAAVRNKANGEIYVSKEVCIPEDLDKVPILDRESFGFDATKHKATNNGTVSPHAWCYGLGTRLYVIYGSRSCPYRCTFCYHPHKHTWRQRTVANCFEEIDYAIKQYNINTVAFSDEMLASRENPKRLLEVCAEMKKRGLKWGCQLRVDAVNDDMLAEMEDSGCVRIAYGVENISDKILKSMKKGISKEQIEKALAMTYRRKIDLQVNLLFFDQAETRETFSENLVWWLQNPKYRVLPSEIIVCPNSEMYLKAIKKGIIKDEIEYISQPISKWMINVTDMPDEEYRLLRSKLREMQQVISYYPGILLNTQKEKNCSDLYRFETICPHCAGHNVYTKIKVIKPALPDNPYQLDCYYTLVCLLCNKRYDLPGIILSTQFENFNKRMYLTNYPANRLTAHYLNRGGSIEELDKVLYPENLTDNAKYQKTSIFSSSCRDEKG